MGGGLGTQGNPNHRLPLLLRNDVEPVGRGGGGIDGLGVAGANSVTASATRDAPDVFKAQLLVVLKEYGNKGMNVSNLKKKWQQVWNQPFPDTGEKSTLLRYLTRHAGDVISVYKNAQTRQVHLHARQRPEPETIIPMSLTASSSSIASRAATVSAST
jgi:hypothetical protein